MIIVDDEYLLRQLIIQSVDWTGMGFEIIEEAKDGEEALRKIEQLQPELVLIDINIPYINGIELSKIIHYPYPDIRMIILTGYAEFDYAKEAIRAGVMHYILKPIHPEELTEAVLDVKQNSRAKSQKKKPAYRSLDLSIS